MTVRCPRCGTQYRRPARGRGTSTFRCARCRHVFDAGRDEPALLADGPEEDEDDDTFTFGDEDEEAGTQAEREHPRGRSRARASEPPPAGETSAARFAFRSMLMVTAAYGIVSIYLYTHAQTTRDALARVPVVGQSLTERRLHPESVQLTDVRGEYQRVKGDRLVFIITGTALNTSATAVRGIQVQGRIVAATEQRQVVFVGAAPRDVRDLSLREIALLQTIEPPKDWALAPGEQASFLVAFADPAPDLREFSAEVVAVQAPRRTTPADVARRN